MDNFLKISWTILWKFSCTILGSNGLNDPCLFYQKICHQIRKKIITTEEIQKYEKFVNFVSLIKLKFQKYKKIANLILLNGEEFQNYLKYANLVPINGEENKNDENIFKLVLLN